MIRAAAGIAGDLKGFAATGVRAVRTRLELIGIELQEEKAWLVRSIVVSVAALYLATFGLLLAVAALVLFAAEANRPAILALCAALFLAGGGGAAAYVFSLSKKRHPMFAESLAVLKGDEQGLSQLMGSTGD